MTEHAVVIAGGGPTGLMLAGELALAGVDVAIVERRPNQDLPGSRAGGLQSRTIEVLDQRGIADRFLAEGQVAQESDRQPGTSTKASGATASKPSKLSVGTDASRSATPGARSGPTRINSIGSGTSSSTRSVRASNRS